MALPYVFNNTVYKAGFFGTDDGGVPASGSFSLDSTYDFPVTVNGTVTGPGSTVTITYTADGATSPTTQTLTVSNLDNANMILFTGTNGVPGAEDGTTNRFVFSNVQIYGNPPPAGQTRTRFTDDGDKTLDSYSVPAAAPCFTSGTLIRTTRGDVLVEALAVGDFVTTASGERRPIKWIGHNAIDCRRHPRPSEVLPIRIKAHAFAENRPARDLVVSPGHAIALDVLGEVLIPASSLINGTTVRQEKAERVTYWHVELDVHDLLLAENMPTESYLDMSNRSFFRQNGEAIVLHGMPDAPASVATHANFCRPFHADGAVVDFVRERLSSRALQMKWTLNEQPLGNMHLIVDGLRIDPETDGLTARFLVPATARTVALVSDAIVPAMAGGCADLRLLGVCVGQLVIEDGFSTNVVSADDARLCAGFHHIEEGPQRWTSGNARIPSELWAKCRGVFFLRVDLTRPALPHWVEPALGHVELLALAS